VKRKGWTMEQRYPTKAARDAADDAIVALDPKAPMTLYVDVWLATYKEHGGIEKPPV